MQQNQLAIAKLVSQWADGRLFTMPIISGYRYPSKEQIRSFIVESNTLNELGLVDWALEYCGENFHELISIERLLFRNTNCGVVGLEVEDGIVLKGMQVSYETLAKGLILATAFSDGSGRIRSSTLFRRSIGYQITKVAVVLANMIADVKE